MRGLQLLILALALLAPVSTPFALRIPLGAAAKAGTAAAKAGRAAEAAVSIERAGGTAAKAGLGAERAAMALSAEQRAALLAREAQEFGVQRAKDGRLLVGAGVASARLIHRRAFTGVYNSPRTLGQRAADGRFTPLAALAPLYEMHMPGLVLVADGRGGTAAPNDVVWAAATQALADVVATAFRDAVFEVQEMDQEARARGGQGLALANRAARIKVLTKNVIRAIQDDDLLPKAQELSVARAAGLGGATLWNVKAVYLFEERNKTAGLWVQLNLPGRWKHGYLARVDLDLALNQILTDGL